MLPRSKSLTHTMGRRLLHPIFRRPASRRPIAVQQGERAAAVTGAVSLWQRNSSSWMLSSQAAQITP